MKVLVQRVSEAACIVNHQPVAKIEKGLLLYVSFNQADQAISIKKMARKVAHLRIFEDAFGKMNKAITAFSYPVLSISQFTLEANTDKGHRPSFTDALAPDIAERFYAQFNAALQDEGLVVKTGDFGAHMAVHSVNDGPVTLLLERMDIHD